MEKKPEINDKNVTMGVMSSLIWAWKKLWKVNVELHGGDTTSSTIQEVWKYADVCVKCEGVKHYPKLIDVGVKGSNTVLYYKLPMGMDYGQIVKSIVKLNCYLKAEVLPRFLENHPKAHFSLTILSGHLLDYIVADVDKIVNELKAKGKGLWIPIGYSRRGLESINLASHDSAHLMIGGAMGGGKSTLLRLILTILHIMNTPEEVNIWACDFKHGNELKILGKDPVLFTRTITDPQDAEDFFAELYEESERRYKEYARVGDVTNLMDYNDTVPKAKRIPHIILMIDELGKLEGKEFERARLILKHIAGDGRAAGVHVVFACHRPTAKLVDGTLKNNMQVRVGFRCNPVSARVFFGEDEWEVSKDIDPEIPGRAIIQFTDHVLLQVPWFSEDVTKEIMSNYQKAKKETKSDSIIMSA